ncbi:MAG: DUF692 domain-containing protein, partial [Myxococcota bacterium]
THSMTSKIVFPHLPVGLGFRRDFAAELFEAPSSGFDFVELAPENFLGFGGQRRRLLARAHERWPILAHGLALSLGGRDPLDPSYLGQLADFLEEIGTPHYSDHLCVSSAGGSHSHELLPLPLTRETARHTARRVREVAAALPVPFAVEHISAYARWPDDELSEPDFVTEVVERAGCGLLLDVNNLYVNSRNFGLQAEQMLERMPLEATLQIHVAGHTRRSDGLRIDSHAEPIVDAVYGLLRQALPRTGPVPVLIERDDNFPPLVELLAEVETIRRIGQEVFGGG